jgi:hypothetical protein
MPRKHMCGTKMNVHKVSNVFRLDIKVLMCVFLVDVCVYSDCFYLCICALYLWMLDVNIQVPHNWRMDFS